MYKYCNYYNWLNFLAAQCFKRSRKRVNLETESSGSVMSLLSPSHSGSWLHPGFLRGPIIPYRISAQGRVWGM